MLSLIFILAGLATLAAAVAPVPGYTIMTDPISWRIDDITPGSSHILNGTIEQVRTQILAINPDFVFAAAPPPRASDFNTSHSLSGICNNETGADLTSSTPAASATASSLTGRNAGDFYCDIFPNAYCYYIADQIEYLYGVAGVPKNGPGPGNCGRVSCSWDTEVLWCNDVSPPSFFFLGFLRLAQMLLAIFSKISIEISSAS
jgi:hypothetical protein